MRAETSGNMSVIEVSPPGCRYREGRPDSIPLESLDSIPVEGLVSRMGEAMLEVGALGEVFAKVEGVTVLEVLGTAEARFEEGSFEPVPAPSF